MIQLHHVLTLAAALFTIGAIGVVTRRNALTILMSIELMLNAANLTFVGFSRFPVRAGVDATTAMGGHAASFFVIAVAAAEAAVGLAIVLAVFRRRETTNVDELTLLQDRGPAPEKPAASAEKLGASAVEPTAQAPDAHAA